MTMSRAQADYDAQTPPEYDERCQCGHLCDDHTDRDDLMQDPSALLDTLTEIAQVLETKANCLHQVQTLVDKALTVCGANGCTCRKFQAIEDDSPDEA